MEDTVLTIITIFVYLIGILSILSSLLIIVMYFRELIRKKATPAFELIFNLSFCELLYVLAFLLLNYPDSIYYKNYNKTICKIQAPIIFFSETCQHIMASIISIYILLINRKVNKINKYSDFSQIFYESNNDIYKKLNVYKRIFYIFATYGISGILTILGLFYEIFGENKFNCWIDEENKKIINLYYIFIGTLIIVNFIIAIKIFRMKFSFLIDEEKLNRQEFSKSLSYYSFITFFSIAIFAVSYYIDIEIELLVIIDNLTLLNGVFYLMICFKSFSFRKKIFKWLQSLFKKKKEDNNRCCEAYDISEFLEDRLKSEKTTFEEINCTNVSTYSRNTFNK